MWRIKYVKYFSVLLGLAIFLNLSCQSRFSSRLVTAAEINKEQAAKQVRASARTSYIHYIPDPARPELQPQRTIRVNVHFMNSKNGSQNYGPEEAPEFGRKLIAGANELLRANQKMWLPLGNTTPVLFPNYQLQLATSQGYNREGGIYCHKDDDLFYFVTKGRNRNHYSRDVIKEYGIGLDSILNLFVMPHHPDSIKSPTYSVTTSGIALGTGVKLSGIFENGKQAYSYRGLVNHEIGHVLGLNHSWSGNDGCEDTPKHRNCWNRSKDGPCATEASNNLMDYNAKQHAWTPCQIGKIHLGFAREGSKSRKLLVKDWCTKREGHTVIVSRDETWAGAKDLAGDIVVKSGARLEIQSRVSLPAGGKISVEPGGELVLRSGKLHNACGYIWQGIEVLERDTEVGKVTFIGTPTFENTSEEFTAALLEE